MFSFFSLKTQEKGEKVRAQKNVKILFCTLAFEMENKERREAEKNGRKKPPFVGFHFNC